MYTYEVYIYVEKTDRFHYAGNESGGVVEYHNDIIDATTRSPLDTSLNLDRN